MNTFQTVMFACFGILIVGFLLATMTKMITGGIEVKMSNRVDYLADDVANQIQQMSSSTIDYSTATMDVDIWGASIDIVTPPDGKNYITIKHKNIEFSQSFHIANDIEVYGSTIDAKFLCFVKQYNAVSEKTTITMSEFDGSACDTTSKDVDLRYDFDWGFDDTQRIQGKQIIPSGSGVIVNTDLPFGKIKEVTFHNYYEHLPDADIYFDITPGEISKYFLKFDVFINNHMLDPTRNNYINFTLDITPLNGLYTDIFYDNRPLIECSNIYTFNCIYRSQNEITFTLIKGTWINITLINTLATRDFYTWGFTDTKTFYNKTITDYPNNTVEMVTFLNFTTPENEYINITPGDIGDNSFSFNLFVPDDDNAVTHNNITLKLNIEPLYSTNIDVKDDSGTIPECYYGTKPCYATLGTKINLNLEPGNYNIRIEDTTY